MPLLGLVQPALAGLEAHLVAADDVFGRVPVLSYLVQFLLGGGQRLPRLGGPVLLLLELLAQLLLPVIQLLGGGGQGGQQLLGLPGGGGLQPLPLLEALQLLIQRARRAQHLPHAVRQGVDALLAGGHVPPDLLQAAPALLDLGGDGARPPLLLLQLLADALGVFAVVFHVVLQQGDAVLAGVDLLVQAGLPSPQLLGLDILVPHLLGQRPALGVQPLHRLPGLVPLADGPLQIRLQFHPGGPQPLQLVQPHGDFQALQLVPEDIVFLCLFRLGPQRLHLELQLADLVVDAHQVFLGALQLALRLLLTVAEAGDARRLLKDLPAVSALDGQDLVDAPLADDGVALPPQASVHEHLVDVLQPAGPSVDIVFALPRPIVPAGHRHLRLLHLEDPLGVVQHQGDLGKTQPLALFRAVEDHVLHLAAPECAGGLLPHHPADGVGDVGLARAVGAHHRRDVRAELQHGLVREGLEALNFQCF